LEVFEGYGANWSYAKTENINSKKVIQTAEKEAISNYCSTGIYYFKKKKWFMEAFNASSDDNSEFKLLELYVAPLYNYLIAKKKDIHVDIIKREEVVFCGVPEEYFDYLESIK
jgi:dTDP-glucose pyrophosphorylase